MNQDQERLLRLGAGAKVAAIAEAIFPVLESLKEQVYQEFAHTPVDNSLHLAKLAGKASILDQILRELTVSMEDGKSASDELQRGEH